MKIDIGTKFFIESDSHNFTIYERKESKRGSLVRGYYSTLRSALGAVPGKAISTSDATSLKEVLAELKMYRQLILKLAEGAR